MPFVKGHNIINILSSEDVVVAGIRYLGRPLLMYAEIKLAGDCNVICFDLRLFCL